jgi:hypothetical protein
MSKIKKEQVVYEDKKPLPTEESINEYYTALKGMDKAINKLDTKQTKMTISIKDTKPIGIAFTGDWHVGARGIDYKQFDEDRKMIINTEGLYCIGMGDYKDNQNALVHANGVNESVAVPGMQDLLVTEFITQLSSKIIALIRGCHDDWDNKVANKDFISTLCEKVNCVNLWHGGGITVKLGKSSYSIRARHKYKNESGLNTTNSQRNMLNDFGPADVIAVAHKHFPDLQMLDRMGQKVIYLRSGSYKVYDEFGQKLAGYRGKMGVPVVIIFPEEKRLGPFEELIDGITYLNAIRG